MKQPFSHVHLHTDYSTYDGVCNVNNVVETAIDHGYDSLGITDHGTLGGIIKFYEACKKSDIKPVIGIEAYICRDMRLMSSEDNKTNHLLLIAKNDEGYKNLVRLSTSANRNGFYKKPRIDFNELYKYKDGLIISSACILGEISRAITNDNLSRAKDIASQYKESFGDNFYLELMFQNGDPKNISEDTKNFMVKQKNVVSKISEMSKELDIKTIVTNDVHYVCQEDCISRYIKMNIHSLGGRENENSFEKNHNPHDTLNYFLKSPEMIYGEWEGFSKQSLINSYELAHSCNVNIPLLSLGDKVKIKLPSVEYFELDKDLEFSNDYLKKDLSLDPVEVKYVRYLTMKELIKKGLTNESYLSRLKMELSVLSCNPEFCLDFLMVKDYIDAARNKNIMTGCGRGSACGSLVLFLLGITKIDPIKFDLDFDRFLSADAIYYTTKEDYA